MTAFLIDTLVWTGALIALVLVLRRPVSRHFGAGAAYALWILPAGRLLLPPIVLPAWMRWTEPVAAPVTASPALPPALPAEEIAVPVSQVILDSATASPVAESTMLPTFDPAVALIAIWLIGAAVFLVRRFSLYFAMRRDLLARARPVGEVGPIRIVETPGANGPVAFGVLDKVVALPVGMMASRDRTVRDLAIAHELAHHRGHDLLANFLVQPLFALHWFSPLGWAGWKALRRDQEAACDARVVSNRPREDRVLYADIIAGLATAAKPTPRHMLAAPMACPVLGDKSIVHRLRSLTMSEISRRRRFAGRILLAGGALALPLTASISYAAQDIAEIAAPAAPQPPQPVGTVQSVAPAAPVAPVTGQEVAAPEAPAEIDGENPSGDRDAPIIIHRVDKDGSAPFRVTFKESQLGALTDEQRAAMTASLAEMRRSLGPGSDFDKEMRELRERFAKDGQFDREVRVAIDESRIKKLMSTTPCVPGADPASTAESCMVSGLSIARSAIGMARNAIERDRNLSDEERSQALGALDEAIAELEAEG